MAAYLGKLADLIYNDVRGYTGGALLVATVAFAIQIYCDFGGYSDIARGCARMMGVRLMENFKAPYLAASMTSFWRRWHISLTSWFREYVYIPLGGNRRGAVRKELNTVATFALSGLWHGASWTFVVWGLFNAGYLVVEDVLSRYCTVTADNGNSRYPKGLCQALGRLWTLCLAVFAWIFFRANTMGDALYVAGRLFTGLSDPLGYLAAAYAAFLPYGWTTLAITACSVALLFAVDYVNERRDVIQMVSGWPGWLRWSGYVGFLVLLVLLIPKESAAPFIYFQF